LGAAPKGRLASAAGTLGLARIRRDALGLRADSRLPGYLHPFRRRCAAAQLRARAAPPSPEKELPYESGIVPSISARRRFSVSFYVTAMLFIVFDVESIFLFPWATIVRQLRVFGSWRWGSSSSSCCWAGLHLGKGALRWD